MVSCHVVTGGALNISAMNAVQISFFEVARIRAEPLLVPQPPKFELTEIPAALLVPKITVAPGDRLSEVGVASLHGAPPAGGKTSTPTCTGWVSVEVHEKKPPSPPPWMTP